MLNQQAKLLIRNWLEKYQFAVDTGNHNAKYLAREELRHYWKQRHKALISIGGKYVGSVVTGRIPAKSFSNC